MTSLPLWVMLAIVFFAGGIGALARHAATVAGSPTSQRVRWRITAVNTTGAFFAGALVAIDHLIALVITVGLFGSLTTFSTIAVWVAEDLRRRDSLSGVRVIFWHLLLGMLAVLAGFFAGQFVS
jgi:CrcB protein